MGTALLPVESMNSTTQQLKNASAYQAMDTSTMSVRSALEISSLWTVIVWCVQFIQHITLKPIDANVVQGTI